MRKSVLLIWLPLVACTQSCRRVQPEPAAAAPAVAAPVAAVVPEPSATPASEAPQAAYPAPAWEPRRLQDALPLCVFSSTAARLQAPLAGPVARQKLQANAKVVFGVFPPGCLNEACDAEPTLQCWVEESGNTLTVHSRFSSFQKQGASCRDDCMPVDSSCETSELKPGRYTVRYGDKRFSLKVPGVVEQPWLVR